MVLVGTGVSVFGKLVVSDEASRSALEKPSALRDDTFGINHARKLNFSFFFTTLTLPMSQAIPLYNYPNFLNLYSVVLYVAVTFVYVMFMMIRYGDEVITLEQRQIPKRTFAIFGLLDTLSIGVQTFASCYISGPLRILLPQAAIPFSMLFSWYFQNKRFRPIQYAGALVVILGIFLVLEPMLMPSATTGTTNSTGFVCETNLQEFDVDEFCYVCQDEITESGCLSHNETRPKVAIANNDTTDIVHLCTWVPTEDSDTSTEQGTGMIWSLAVILSCIPMTLSSLYKEITVSKVEVEPLYMNGWTAFFQFPYSLGLAVMAAPLFSPPIEPHELPRHLLNAWDCYYHGRGTVDHGCHLDDECGKAFWLWNLNFALIVMYTVLSVLLLKYGSTSLLYLALTITVPLGNLAFCLPFMPGYAPMRISDLLGLIVIVLGLVLYRSNGDTEQAENSDRGQSSPTDDVLESLQEPLLQEQEEQQ
ncbi:MAG: hypothetical protein SGBAC_006218 [Bacillariaceae sp.]